MQRHSAPLPQTTGTAWRFASPPDGDGSRADVLPVVVRNGLPGVPYVWRARRYPLAERALRLAEAEHGLPES